MGGGQNMWKPTDRGRELGLASRTVPIGLIMMGLDVDDLMAEWNGQLRSEVTGSGGAAGCAPTDSIDDALDERPLFIIRPAKKQSWASRSL